MEIQNVLRPCNISIGLKAADKGEALGALCALLEQNGYVSSAKGFLADVVRREAMGPTGIGDGIAIPHGQSDTVLRSAIAIGKLAEEISWETHVGPGCIRVIILFVVQDDEDFSATHLRMLAGVARKLAHQKTLDALMTAQTPEQVIDSLR